MTAVKMKEHYDADADKVWQVIGNFQTLHDWHPMVSKSESKEGGTVRKLTLPDGSSVTETLKEHSNKARSYTYAITQSALPVSNYVATIRVTPDKKGGCTVEWSSDFEAHAAESDVVKGMEQLYQSGFDNLRKMFGAG